MLSIAIIDDNSELLELLRDYLAADARFAPLQAFDSGAPALEAARKGKFSVVLIDIRLLNDSGLRWIRRIREACPAMRILAYTCVDSEETVITAIEAGADGYLLKQASFTEIVASILEAVKGLPVASGVALRALFRLVRKDFVSSQHHDLSPAELRILELSAKGYDCKTVAKKLGISVQTVYVHNRRIFRKLGVTNRLAAIAKLQEKDSGPAITPKIAVVSG